MAPLRPDFRMISTCGTEWPIPRSWREKSPGVFEGDGGGVSIFVQDGGLIDPARCRQAAAADGLVWKLVDTRNGVAVSSVRCQAGFVVLVCVVKVDGRLCGDESMLLPEVQVVYVVPDARASVVEMVRDVLGRAEASNESVYELDAFGHLVVGPVPVCSDWQPAGEEDAVGRRVGSPSGVLRMLLGGGWIVLEDRGQCCGVSLVPVPWRGLSALEVEEAAQRGLAERQMKVRIVSETTARVGRLELAREGVSFCAIGSGGQVHAGAFWADPLGQVWRLDYWLDLAHSGDIWDTLNR